MAKHKNLRAAINSAFKSKKKVPDLTVEKLKQIRKFIHNDLCGSQRMSKRMIQATIDTNGGPVRMKRLIDSMK